MSIAPSELTVTDPLAEQEVTVVVRVLPDGAPRPARTALVSVGTAGQPPAFASGPLEQVADLIRQAWLAYGVWAEMQTQPITETTEAETVAEASVDDHDDGAKAQAAEAPATEQQPAATPRPRPQNLSLF